MPAQIFKNIDVKVTLCYYHIMDNYNFFAKEIKAVKREAVDSPFEMTNGRGRSDGNGQDW